MADALAPKQTPKDEVVAQAEPNKAPVIVRRPTRGPIGWMIVLTLCLLWLGSATLFLHWTLSTASKNMKPVAEYATDYALLALDKLQLSLDADQLATSATGLAVSWWLIWLSLTASRDLDPSYVATPITLSVFLMFIAGFTFLEYAVVLLPGIMCVWELLGDK